MVVLTLCSTTRVEWVAECSAASSRSQSGLPECSAVGHKVG